MTDNSPAMTEPHSPLPTLTIIVPVYNGGGKFKQCLDSIRPCLEEGCEVLVVADGPSDGSWEYARELGMETLVLPTNGGPARARNLGAAQANGEILFFVDADVTLHGDTLSRVRSAFGKDPDLAALFGSYDNAPGEMNFLSQYRNLFHHFIHQQSRTRATTFWSGCGAVRKEIFLDLGGFNTDYARPCIEDIELGYRLCQYGAKVELHRDIQVCHLKRWEIRSMVKTDFFDRALPWTRLLLGRGGLINDLNLTRQARASVVLSFLLLLLPLAGLALTGTPAYGALLTWLGVGAGLIHLNRRFYRFLMGIRGWKFVAKTLFWHWIYFLISGAAFALGWLEYHLAPGGKHGRI